MTIKGQKSIPGFNPAIRGLLVQIKGYNEDGDKLDFPCRVQSVMGDKITVSKPGISDSETFYLNEFGVEENGYGLQMLIYNITEEVEFEIGQEEDQ